MAQLSFKASAPGSLMVMGEHAVLHHHRAIVAAVDQRIYVSLTPRDDKVLTIHSALGEYEGTISNLEVKSPFEYVLAAIEHYAVNLKTGFSLTIESEFRHDLGLGSSAAVLVATLSVLQQWLEGKVQPQEELFATAKAIVHQLKGKGSGADIAASIYGGVVQLQTDPLKVTSLPLLPELTVVYCGYKTPTAKVIELVGEYASTNPEGYKALYQEIDGLVDACAKAIMDQDWPKVGQYFSKQQKQMQALGVSDAVIDAIIEGFSHQPTVLGSKISGSGLGDCVIGLGAVASGWQDSIAHLNSNIAVLPVHISEQGLLYD